MKKFKVSPNEREDQLYDRWREHQAAREKEQQEKAQKAANELLNSAPNMGEYCKRREAQEFLVVEPNIPLDEMTMSDYLKVRNR
jgi:hypothetical protein